MEMQLLINIAAGAFISSFVWFGKELWAAVKMLRDDLHRIEVALPDQYVKRADLDKRLDHVEEMIQRIYDKLENKADKL